MEGRKNLDAVSRIPHYSGAQMDAVSAYTQEWLGGHTTWVSLPQDCWPDWWQGKFRNPVCVLALNLYGYPTLVRIGSPASSLVLSNLDGEV